MNSKSPENTHTVGYKLEHARFVTSVRVTDILYEPERMAVFAQLKAGSRLVLFRDYRNRRDPQAVRIARSIWEPLAYLEPGKAAVIAPLLDNGKYLYAIVTRVFKTKTEFTVRVYEPETVAAEKLSTVSLEVVSAEDTSHNESFTLFIKEKKLFFEERERGRVQLRFELFFSEEEWKNVRELVEIVNFLAWEHSYDEICENYDRWRVTLHYGRGKTFCSTGGRIRPEELNIFMKYLESCLYLRSKKGRGFFCTPAEYKEIRRQR